MNRTIKIIDLLNKIADGEEVPKNIRFEGVDFRFENDTYYRANTLYSLIDYIKIKRSSLNEDVEIIEEEPEIDIQQIEELEVENYGEIKIMTENGEMTIASDETDRINQLIKAVKQLDRQINNK